MTKKKIWPIISIKWIGGKDKRDELKQKFETLRWKNKELRKLPPTMAYKQKCKSFVEQIMSRMIWTVKTHRLDGTFRTGMETA